MSGDGAKGLREQFDRLIEMAPEERARALNELLAEDPELGEQLRALLPADTTGAGDTADPIARRVLRSLESTPLPSGQLGPYRLLRLLGSGGMGWVYLAERDVDGVTQQVALKLVPGSDQATAVELFQRERSVLASLQHPNIARFLDAGTVDGQRYLAMEYIEGQSLARWLEERQPSLQQRLTLLVALARAVDHAHGRLVVHRDLKPANLLVRSDDSPVLLDFGIAKLLADEEPGRATSTRIYTPTYAAPEQLAGEPVTVATDVYALGLLLFEILCGEPARKDAHRALRTQPSGIARDSDRSWVRRDASGIDVELDRIVAMALREEPERRYRSAAELAADIERWQQGLPVHAMPDSLAYRSRKWLRRHRWGATVAATALVGTVFFVVQLQTALNRALLAEETAQREARTAQAVADLMTDLFEGADPRIARNADLSARALLERGAERLNTQLSGDVAIDAQLRFTMGELLAQIGDREAAIAQFEAGLALESTEPLDPLQRADLLHELARAQSALDREAPAEAAAREALALRERVLGPDALAVGHALQSLAVPIQRLGRSDEAEALFRRAEAIFASQEPPDLGGLASSRHNLGWIAQRRGDYPLAIRRLQQAVDNKTELYGWDDPRTLFSMVPLAQSLADNGDTAAGIEWMERAVEGRRRVNGNDSMDTLFALKELAFLQHDQGEFDQALANYQEALEIGRRVAPESGDVARTLNNMASLQEQRGDLASAEALLRESLALRQVIFGPDDVNTLRVEHNLCRVRLQQEGDAAQACAAEIFERRRRFLGESSAETDDSRALVESLSPTPDRDWLLDRYRHYMSQGASQIVRSMRYAWLLAADNGEAEDLDRLRTVADALREFQGSTSVRAAQTELELAQLALRLGRVDLVGDALSRSETILDRTLAPQAAQRIRLRELQSLNSAR
ncbi:serine/threonine-protein kinase [Wenzhouxiangella marina]|uniref:Uncharacterized protein n=1 Tax=Wenzhouxiangella marina TaxID=1579979 RepID=A0A0K0XV97_9GAMM|nr:serine/threonine-protein kinase [Wenzhouxiangella marina]AKS41541.1 hypothetical protein WM2015_1167 [Wenzhouxiangella marina]MBB6086700.1 serine/threonine-protein kinase [Wenzhouxiangella marina]